MAAKSVFHDRYQPCIDLLFVAEKTREIEEPFKVAARDTAGATPATGRWRLRAPAINGPIVVAGVAVRAGDPVVAKAAGVVLVPFARCAAFLLEALRIHDGDTPHKADISRGTTPAELAPTNHPLVWVKLFAAYRLSVQPDLSEPRAFQKPLMAVRSDRLLWGTDSPHPRFAGTPPQSLDLLATFVERKLDTKVRHRILVDIPVELFFGAPLPA